MLRSRNSILLHVVKVIVSATSGKIRAFPNLLLFPWVLHHHSSCDQIARVCTGWANSDMWSSYRSCNLQLKLPELVTLNFFPILLHFNKIKMVLACPPNSTTTPRQGRAIACFNQVLGLFPSICQRSWRASVTCGEVFRLYARAVCRRMPARASSTSPASLKWGKILGDMFFIWSSKSNIQLFRRQDASWSFKASRILCSRPEVRRCFCPTTVSSLFCSTASCQEWSHQRNVVSLWVEDLEICLILDSWL